MPSLVGSEMCIRDSYDDMVRDVRNCTSTIDLRSPAAADRAVEDLSVRDLLEQIRETTDGDLDFNPAGSAPFGDPPVDTRSGTLPEGESPSGPGRDSNSHGSSGRSSRGGAASRGGRGSHGGAASRRVVALCRSVPLPDKQRMHPMQEL